VFQLASTFEGRSNLKVKLVNNEWLVCIGWNCCQSQNMYIKCICIFSPAHVTEECQEITCKMRQWFMFIMRRPTAMGTLKQGQRVTFMFQVMVADG